MSPYTATGVYVGFFAAIAAALLLAAAVHWGLPRVRTALAGRRWRRFDRQVGQAVEVANDPTPAAPLTVDEQATAELLLGEVFGRDRETR